MWKKALPEFQVPWMNERVETSSDFDFVDNDVGPEFDKNLQIFWGEK